MHCLNRFMLLAVVSLVFLTLPSISSACSPTATPPNSPDYFTLAERTKAADIVFDGTLLGRPKANAGIIEVHHYFKGNGPAQVYLVGLGNGPDCRPGVAVGERVIFFAMGNPQDVLSVPEQFPATATQRLAAETQAELVILAGSAIEPIPHSSAVPVYAPFHLGIRDWLVIGSGSIIALILATLYYRKRLRYYAVLRFLGVF
jgi:hypothetical protein